MKKNSMPRSWNVVENALGGAKHGIPVLVVSAAVVEVILMFRFLRAQKLFFYHSEGIRKYLSLDFTT